jgi:RimJ/RimL family protein N-acetyltransferase
MAEYRLVNNNPAYWEFIRELRTMQGVREGFVSQKEITPVEQATYMLKHNSDFWICIDGQIPAGYVGVIEGDIRVATHPDYQGKGVGTFMINEIMNFIPTAIARVKLDNEASIRLFERCGFKKKYYILEKENET